MSKPRKSQTPVAAKPEVVAVSSNGKAAHNPLPQLDMAAIEKAKDRIDAAKRKLFDAERALEEEQSKLGELLGPLKELNKIAGGR